MSGTFSSEDDSNTVAEYQRGKHTHATK